MAPELADLAEPGAVLAGVRHQRRVELLRARARLAPLEEAERVGAPRDVGERVEDGAAGHLGGVDRLPVHGAGRVLHEQPGAPAGQPAGEVAG